MSAREPAVPSDPFPFGVLLLDAAGTIRAADAAASILLRSNATALVGTSLSRLAAGAEATHEEFRRGLETDGMELSFPVPMEDRAETVHVHIRSLRAAEAAGCVGFVFRGSAPAADVNASGAADLVHAAEVAGRIKHDINNLLMGLLGHVTLLRDRAELGEAARRKIELIEQLGKKIRDRIADLDAIRKAGGTTS